MKGEPITEEQIQAWADEAERGYSVERLRRGGRPAVGDSPGEVIAVRMDETLLSALAARAARDHVSRSEAIRAAVRAWIDAA
jgi:Ribbon-helix-helix protein, copG family